MSTANSFDEFLGDFRETLVSATARLQEISPEQSRRQPAPDAWAPIQILGHLVDSAANNHQRFVRAQFTDDLVSPGYDGDRWVSAQQYLDASWPDVIQLWNSYNLHMLHVFSVIPTDVLTKSREKHNLDETAFKVVPRNESTTLEYFIRDYVDHLRHHLDQIFSQTS